jgi:terminase large subunit-like protein
MGWTPDPWQKAFLHSKAKRETLLCARQAGKSTGAAARALPEALLNDGALCLIFCPTMRQSMEMLLKVQEFDNALGNPVELISVSKTSRSYINGSRIIALPDNETGIVGFSGPRLILIDEGSRVSDILYKSVSPMLGVSRGQMITLSTPFGSEGWFFDLWDESLEARMRREKLNEKWRHTAVNAYNIPRLGADFLHDQRIELGQRWYSQEFELEWLSSIDAVFSREVIDKVMSGDEDPLTAQMLGAIES